MGAVAPWPWTDRHRGSDLTHVSGFDAPLTTSHFHRRCSEMGNTKNPRKTPQKPNEQGDLGSNCVWPANCNYIVQTERERGIFYEDQDFNSTSTLT